MRGTNRFSLRARYSFHQDGCPDSPTPALSSALSEAARFAPGGCARTFRSSLEVLGQTRQPNSVDPGSEMILPTPPLPGSRPQPFQNDQHGDLFGNLRARRHRGDSSAIEDVTVAIDGWVLPYVREIPVGVPRNGVGTDCFAVDAGSAQRAANRHTGRRCASRDGSIVRRYSCSVSMFLWPVT